MFEDIKAFEFSFILIKICPISNLTDGPFLTSYPPTSCALTWTTSFYKLGLHFNLDLTSAVVPATVGVSRTTSCHNDTHRLTRGKEYQQHAVAAGNKFICVAV